MTTKTIALTPQVRDVLERSEITAGSLKLPAQLDRKLYVATMKIIETAGGKWNRGRACHVFTEDPREKLGLAIETGKAINEKQTFQIFYTPPALAERLVSLSDIEPGNEVLEPSAGTGNILRAINKDFSRPRIRVTAVEIQEERTELINLAERVHYGDFLKVNGELGAFDRVVMNPPFSNGDDIRHIEHARRKLKPRGRVVAVCANGPRQQEKLRPIALQWIELPPGAFKESGTNIAAAICIFEATGGIPNDR